MCVCCQGTELSNIKCLLVYGELVYGQVCLVFISSTSFEGQLTPQNHTSSTINSPESTEGNILHQHLLLKAVIIHVKYYWVA